MLLRSLPSLALALCLLGLLSATSASAATQADLGVTDPFTDGESRVGMTAAHSTQVSNNGPDPVEATVSVGLGEAEEFVSLTASQGTCTQSAPYTCSLGVVSPREPVTVTSTVRYVRTSADNVFSFNVSGPADNYDPDVGNNVETESVEVTDGEETEIRTPTASTGSWSRAQASLAVEAELAPYGTGTYYFEYGRTKSYGERTSTRTVTADEETTVRAKITGLRMSTVYHYRIVLIVDGRTYRGGDESARTLGKLKYGPLTLKVKSKTATKRTYTGSLGDGLADAPGACKGTVRVEVYTLGGATLLTRSTRMRKDCTYRITVPFGSKQARRYGGRGKVLVQARFSGNRAVSSVGSTADKP